MPGNPNERSATGRLADPVAVLPYESSTLPVVSKALRRLTLFIFLMCLARIAYKLIWPVDLWQLPPFSPADLATTIDWWNWMEVKIELASQVLLCAASAWFLFRSRQAWRPLWISAIAFTALAAAQDVIMLAVSVAHHLGYLQPPVTYATSPWGIPGLFLGTAFGLLGRCGATLVLTVLLHTAMRAQSLLAARRPAMIACATLVPMCLWLFVGSMDEQSRLHAAKQLKYLTTVDFSFVSIGVIGNALYFPVLFWMHLAVAVAAAVALATNLRRRRPLLIMLASALAILAVSDALLSLVAVAEYLGRLPSPRFGTHAQPLKTAQWLSSFVSHTLSGSSDFVACFILLLDTQDQQARPIQPKPVAPDR